ncbi:MAG: trimeric intracellular cation channel family protein [Hyphomicrobiales bacterium]|uniref:trimeric intracellular cation channel family protein n=1 Tax=Rhabdaerophilum calidifontis TaxID=2604328 RepID=UPI00123B4D21|nr:trimeric intracellular cation channel family protein [Rhabdaerophilum calidifontis]MCA1951601.1 trimeric intracellular cation channel family protein [Hyphomicrobiales bacterium]MCA1998803.1 trimeric intracellular cation channel family protein [Hyphomicrobiales bacterium]
MISDVIAAIGWLGLVAFAVSGALVASRKQLDIVAFIFFGTVTGIGGGTFRDLVLGQAPVFWVRDPTPLLVCAAVSAATFFLAHVPESRLRLLLWLDAAGMAVFCVLGAEAAREFGFAVAISCGVITAVVGGFIRDMMGAEMPVIMRGEIYATAAFAGAAAFLIAGWWLPRDLAALIGIGAAFGLRAAALVFRWRLPVYRRKPGRSPEELGL